MIYWHQCMLCSHFSNFTFWFSLPSSTSYIIFAFPEQCTWWSGHQKSYRCSKHWSLHQALNFMVLDLHRRILCCMPSILIFCNKVRWWEPRKRSIFQTLWRLHHWTIFFLFLEWETSNSDCTDRVFKLDLHQKNAY